VTAEGVLLDAFRSIGPLVGSSQADEVRDAAAARLLETLYRLVSPLRMDRGVKDDVVQVVVTRLCRSGPRGVRAGDPESDEALERYLRRALWNALRDRAPRHVTIDWDAIQGMLISNEPSPAAVFEGKARQTRLDETRALLGRVIDDAVGDLGARAATGFRAAVAQLTAIADGREDLDAILETEMAATAAPAPPKVARDRLYKRYQRALEHIGDTIDRQTSEGRLTITQQDALRAAVDGLRLRPKR
jgi:DNA-directed RNA polymerase specialized sigma24 family protein